MFGRLAGGATLSIAFTLSLTACVSRPEPGSGGSGAGAARAELASAWQRTRQVDTYKVDETVTSSGFSQEPTNWRRVGEVRLRPSPAKKTTIVSGTVGRWSAAGIQEIVIGDTEYLWYPSVAERRPAKPWIKASLKNSWASDGLDYDAYARQTAETGIAGETRVLTASKDARKAGAETIDGTPTTHYTGTISEHNAWATFDDRTRSQFEQYFRKLGITSVGFDVWVDRDLLPRKLITRVAGPQGSQTRTSYYSEFGEAVTITPPSRTRIGAPKLLPPARRPSGHA